ncbi:adenosine receptor A2b-like [Gigantopelta aegis]|uniref:adenosine receptor A2b-like n=1 Tax=Gigantopelta aegis TaxID=1735272 RepID=UPI001B88CEE0|nr:adenosine receptor A2b-like [Gigantopelta aegis]
MNSTNISVNASATLGARHTTGLGLIPVHLLISAFICTVNILTISIFLRSPSLRTTIPNLYLVSLALTDLLTGMYIPCISIPLLFASTTTFCFLSFAAFILLSCQSFLTITLIGVDRFIYIIYPFKYDNVVSPWRAKATIVTSWLASTAVAITAYPTSQWRGLCQQVNTMSPKYLNGILILFISLTVIVGVLYAVITRAALHQRNMIRVVTLSRENCARQPCFKYIRLFLLVYCLFVMFWLPVFLVFLIKYVTGYHSLVSQRIAITMAFLNSGSNFFVYVWKNKDFRRALQRMCACKREHFDSPGTRSTNLEQVAESLSHSLQDAEQEKQQNQRQLQQLQILEQQSHIAGVGSGC